MDKIIHHGKNVKLLREMQGIQQAELAYELGVGWNLESIVKLEQQEIINDILLKQIAGILNLPVKTIREYDSQKTINIIATAQDNIKIKFPLYSKPVYN